MPSPRFPPKSSYYSRINLSRVSFEYLLLICVAHPGLFVDVLLRIVVVLVGLRIDPADGSNHLGSKQYIVDRNNLRQQIETRLVINTCIEEHVVANHVRQHRTFHILSETAIPAPM